VRRGRPRLLACPASFRSSSSSSNSSNNNSTPRAAADDLVLERHVGLAVLFPEREVARAGGALELLQLVMGASVVRLEALLLLALLNDDGWVVLILSVVHSFIQSFSHEFNQSFIHSFVAHSLSRSSNTAVQ
jgi:hypothetical protein